MTVENKVDLFDRRDCLRKILCEYKEAQPTNVLHERLCAELALENHIPKNTQRDLEALERIGDVRLVKLDSDLRANFWEWAGPGLDLTLLPTEAMTVSAIIDHAARFGLQAPPQMLGKLRKYVDGVMSKGSHRKLEWAKRIITGTRFTVLKPGRSDPAHVARIQDALRYNEPLKVTYLPRDAEGVECVYHLKPLALSYQDSNIYLSAYVLTEEWPEGCAPEPGARRGKYSSNGPKTQCALMLHRVVAVGESGWEIPEPEDFDVNSLEAQKHLMTIHGDEPVELRLRLGANLHNRLTENPLADDQTMVQSIDGKWDLNCTLRDTQGLRLFLLSNADEIEVLGPLVIREHVRETLRRAVAHYADD
ncbi:WYL domain-containing protein [Pseudomonas sp. PSB11]|nr:WYL domain-containing protein [Pseudomonas sp. PSB11]